MWCKKHSSSCTGAWHDPQSSRTRGWAANRHRRLCMLPALMLMRGVEELASLEASRELERSADELRIDWSMRSSPLQQFRSAEVLALARMPRAAISQIASISSVTREATSSAGRAETAAHSIALDQVDAQLVRGPLRAPDAFQASELSTPRISISAGNMQRRRDAVSRQPTSAAGLRMCPTRRYTTMSASAHSSMTEAGGKAPGVASNVRLRATKSCREPVPIAPTVPRARDRLIRGQRSPLQSLAPATAQPGQYRTRQ